MLDQDADHALEAAEDGAVQHDGRLARRRLRRHKPHPAVPAPEVDLQGAARQSRPIASRSTNSSLGP